LIEQYLAAIGSVVKQDANIVIRYSDQTKVMAQLNQGFAENAPAKKREAVEGGGIQDPRRGHDLALAQLVDPICDLVSRI
jgi:hypothetical protein